jgi:hypothetical protein
MLQVNEINITSNGSDQNRSEQNKSE